MQSEIKKVNYEDAASMPSRRQARRLALQVLFCNEFLNEDIHEVADRVAETLQEEVGQFTRELITRTSQNKWELDQLILMNLKDWDLDRVALIDHILIRLALSELLYFPEIPPEVTINEAVELCKEFMNHKSTSFVNGILDTILKKLREEKKV